MFIICLCKFDKKILAINQTACQPWPILAKTLDTFSKRICWDILKRKKTGEVLDLYESPHGRNFQYLQKNSVLNFFAEPRRPPSRCPWSITSFLNQMVHVLPLCDLFKSLILSVVAWRKTSNISKEIKVTISWKRTLALA